jgi:hypothetical protein
MTAVVAGLLNVAVTVTGVVLPLLSREDVFAEVKETVGKTEAMGVVIVYS